MGNPLATVDAVYAAIGQRLTGPARTAMHGYVEAHPKGALGDHAYDLASFGLDEGTLRARFADYTARYDIPSESAPR